MLHFATLALALALAGSGWAQVPTTQCPNVKLASGFSPQKYFKGRWYEQKRFPLLYEAGQKCVTAQYSLAANGTVTVTNSGYNVNTRKRVYANGTAYCESSQPAYCHVRFSSYTPYGTYKVLATDYNSYGLVYSCQFVGFFNVQSAWILTRQKNPTKQLITNALSIFKKNGVDTSLFTTTLQDCADN